MVSFVIKPKKEKLTIRKSDGTISRAIRKIKVSNRYPPSRAHP